MGKDWCGMIVPERPDDLTSLKHESWYCLPEPNRENRQILFDRHKSPFPPSIAGNCQDNGFYHRFSVVYISFGRWAGGLLQNHGTQNRQYEEFLHGEQRYKLAKRY